MGPENRKAADTLRLSAEGSSGFAQGYPDLWDDVGSRDDAAPDAVNVMLTTSEGQAIRQLILK